MSRQFPPGHFPFGAPMGRRESNGTPEGLIRVFRVMLDAGGYDDGGCYWGTGEPLYRAEDESGEYVQHIRASDRDAAIVALKIDPAKVAPPPADVRETDTFREVLAGYIEAALATTCDESDESGGEPLDRNYSEDDLSDDLRAQFEDDVEKFLAAIGGKIPDYASEGRYYRASRNWTDAEQAGHDLWLDANGHGSGAGDHGLPDATADALYDAAQLVGGTDLYVDDEGKIDAM